jgi:hypothetical protein
MYFNNGGSVWSVSQLRDSLAQLYTSLINIYLKSTNPTIKYTMYPTRSADYGYKGRQLYNCYGPAETTEVATFAEILPGAANITIGKPVSNARI